jgi:methyltransferase
MIVSILILSLVTAQRLGELVIARRNTRRLLAEGGVERGAEHYPLMVALHAAWLGGLWTLAWDRPANLWWVMAYLLIEALRVWVLTSIGARWTTRIIVVPGETLVRKGPYRLIPHPNYAVVVAEIVVLPLVFGLVGFAVVFSVLNAAMLWLRIRTESAALRQATAPQT